VVEKMVDGPSPRIETVTNTRIIKSGKLMYMGRFNKKFSEYLFSDTSSLIIISPRIINKENPMKKAVG